MKTLKIRKALEDDLRPKYEESRDSNIDFTLSLLKELQDKKFQLDETIKRIKKDKREFESNSKEEENEIQELRVSIYGEFIGYSNPYNPKYNNGYDNGFKQSLSKEHQTLLFDKRAKEKDIKEYYTKKFEKTINDTLDYLLTEIEKLNPISIKLGYSEYDFNFILDINNKQRSFTINTIIAGGNIQCIHYRTLKRLHKGVV